MERLQGTVQVLKPEKGFGLLKVPGHRTHHFQLSDAPAQIRRYDIVTFCPAPGSPMPHATEIQIVQDAKVAA